MAKDFEVIRLPAKSGGLQVNTDRFVAELRPTRLYVLPDGTIDEKGSYIFWLEDMFGNVFLAQISDKMLRDGLRRADINVLPSKDGV